MSKKYVIELEDAPYRKSNGMSEPLYRVKGFNSLVFDQNGLDKLEKFDFDYIKNHLDFGVLQDEAYQKGLEDAREGRTLCENCRFMSNEIYEPPCVKCKENYVNQFRPKDAEDNQIRVGDEVVSLNKDGNPIEGFLPWVVMSESDYAYFGIDTNRMERRNPKISVRKTGRHFDEVDKLLEEMKA